MKVLSLRGRALRACFFTGLLGVAGMASAGIDAGVQVNTTTLNSQEYPAIARAPDGRFVVVWATRSPECCNASLQAQRFDAAGNPVGGEIQVASAGALSYDTDVAMGPGGEFTVVWTAGTENTSDGVFARRFDAHGNPFGNAFQVPAPGPLVATTHSPAIAADATGGFIVVWSHPFHYKVVGRRFGANGNPVGLEFVANTRSDPYPMEPDIAAGPDGSFVVAWREQGLNDVPAGIHARRYAADGTPGAVFRVSDATAEREHEPSVAVDADGGFAVVWERSAGSLWNAELWARQYEAAGNPTAGQLRVDIASTHPRGPAAAFTENQLIVTWMEGQAASVVARRFAASGAPTGPKLVVAPPDPAWHFFNLYRPAMAVAGDGSMLVTWTVGAFVQGDWDGDIHLRRATLSSQPELDLAAYLSGPAHAVDRNTVVPLAIEVANFGPAVGTDVTAVLRLTPDVAVDNLGGDGWECLASGGGLHQCSLPWLAAGTSTQLSARVRAPFAGSLTANLQVSSAQYDAEQANDADSLEVQVIRDIHPLAFHFADRKSAQLNAWATSDAVRIYGINAPAPVSVTGGEWRVYGVTDWLTGTGTVKNGQYVQVRHKTGLVPATSTNTTLTVGGVSDTFSSTTFPGAVP